MGRKKRRGTKFTLVLLFAVLLPFVVLAIGLPFFIPKRQLIMPEVREALQARREAPENTLHLLDKAEELLTPPGGPAIDLYVPGLAAQGETIPDDVEGLNAYLEASGPGIEIARQAAGGPYYLSRNQQTIGHVGVPDGPNDPSSTVFSHLLTHAVYRPAQERVDVLSNALRLARTMRQDGPSSVRAESGTLLALIDVARQADAAELNQLAGLLADTPPPDVSMRPLLESILRSADETSVQGVAENRNVVEGTLRAWVYQRMMDNLIKEKDNLLALAEVHPKSIHDWALRPERRDAMGNWKYPWSMVPQTVDYGRLLSLFPAARIVVALEQYERANGAYPKELQALVPNYLDELPEDTGSQAPFVYRLADDGYTLYSQSFNGMDNQGNKRLDWVWVAPPEPEVPGMPQLFPGGALPPLPPPPTMPPTNSKTN